MSREHRKHGAEKLLEDLLASGWYHSFHLPDGTAIDGAIPVETLRRRVGQMPIPDDLRGKRVLDVGAWDGWFSFEMERRGAEVVAVDCVELDHFAYIRRRLGSRVRYVIRDITELDPRELGTFDIVLCLGVLYHLKHPLLGLERVCRMTRDLAVVETFTIPADDQPRPELPYLEFYERDELRGQIDNWFGPSADCVPALARSAGFARVEPCAIEGDRAAFACYRRWPPASGNDPEPEVRGVAQAWNFGFNFRQDGDEYISCWFTHPWPEIGLDQLFPEVGGFGVAPVHVKREGGDAWMVSFRVPPGLAVGWHDVTLRVGSSERSCPRRIAVGIPAQASRLEIRGLCDGLESVPGEVRRVNGSHLSLWIAGLPHNADRGNVRILIDGVYHAPLFVGDADPEGVRQVNVPVKDWMGPGEFPCEVECGGVRSAAVGVKVV
ncbi:MAG: class I SAM-dependent methyltransferase [Bryobacteraceae bacterium]